MVSRTTPSAGHSSQPSSRRPVRITLIRPPAVASLHAYSIAVVPPLGPAYIAAALESAGHQVTVIDALGEAPLARHPSAHPRLVAHGLTIAEIVARIPPDVQGIGVSVMFSQQWPHVAVHDSRRIAVGDERVRGLQRERHVDVVFVDRERGAAAPSHIRAVCIDSPRAAGLRAVRGDRHEQVAGRGELSIEERAREGADLGRGCALHLAVHGNTVAHP